MIKRLNVGVYLIIFGHIFDAKALVRRVHWLRARAQLNRWQEQVTLTTYEMEWTVRYFLNMKEKWLMKANAGTVTSPGPSSVIDTSPQMTLGSMAYWNRKKAVWEDLVKKADSFFKISNPAYQSPL